MVTKSTKADERRRALAAFPEWMDLRLRKQISNIQALRSVMKEASANPVLEFTIPLAMNQIVEHSCLRVLEAWDLLNDELAHQRRRTIGVKNRDYVYLKRIRNKLVAHRVPNDLTGGTHRNWYLKKYGSFDSVMTLIQRVGEKVSHRICQLQVKGDLPFHLRLSRPVVGFDVNYLKKMIQSLRSSGFA